MTLATYLGLIEDGAAPKPCRRIVTLSRRVQEVEALLGRPVSAADAAAWGELATKILALDDAAIAALRHGIIPDFLKVA